MVVVVGIVGRNGGVRGERVDTNLRMFCEPPSKRENYSSTSAVKANKDEGRVLGVRPSVHKDVSFFFFLT